MSVENSLNRTSEHTSSLAVYNANLAKAEAGAFIQVLGDEGGDVARVEGVQVELVGDLHLDGTVSVAVLDRVVVLAVAGHQPKVG